MSPMASDYYKNNSKLLMFDGDFSAFLSKK